MWPQHSHREELEEGMKFLRKKTSDRRLILIAPGVNISAFCAGLSVKTLFSPFSCSCNPWHTGSKYRNRGATGRRKSLLLSCGGSFPSFVHLLVVCSACAAILKIIADILAKCSWHFFDTCLHRIPNMMQTTPSQIQ